MQIIAVTSKNPITHCVNNKTISTETIKFAIDSTDSKMHQQKTHVIQNLVKIKQQQVRLRGKKTNQHCLSIFNGSLNIYPIKQKYGPCINLD